MTVAKRVQREQFGEVRYSAAQLRTIEAALRLFAIHGVNGTSLQMIADAVGVTKAAIYHQFRAKDEIVVATADHEMLALQEAVTDAESEPDRTQARLFMLRRMIDYSVNSRALIRAWESDPEMVRVLAEFPPYMNLMRRMYGLLVQDEQHRVLAAMLSAAISAVATPTLTDIDDETLSDEVFAYACRLLGLQV
jgi:AcrR family transcriptional regulator